LEAQTSGRGAVEYLAQRVSSQSVQASGPPFDPFIYCTSPATFHSRRYCVLFVFEKISLLRQNLFHCRVRFHPLQEKNAFPAASSAAERAAERRNERGSRPSSAARSSRARRCRRLEALLERRGERADRAARPARVTESVDTSVVRQFTIVFVRGGAG